MGIGRMGEHLHYPGMTTASFTRDKILTKYRSIIYHNILYQEAF